MATDIKHRETPEEKELHRKLTELNELESELAQQELDLATLHGGLRAFEARYLRIIGTRYAQLDKIEAQIAEIEASLAMSDNNSQQRAAQAWAKAYESAQAANVEQQPLKQESFLPSESLKKLYREVAKSVHPDLANDEEERVRRQQLMAEANRAYEEGDEARLEEILRDWEISPETVKGNGVGAELVRVIRKITQVKERLNAIETEIDLLKESELYQLKIKVEEVEDEGRDLLCEMALQLDDQIALAKQRLEQTKDNGNRWT